MGRAPGQLGDLALQQAELLNGDVESIADGAGVLLSTVAQVRAVGKLAPDCDRASRASSRTCRCSRSSR